MTETVRAGTSRVIASVSGRLWRWEPVVLSAAYAVRAAPGAAPVCGSLTVQLVGYRNCSGVRSRTGPAWSGAKVRLSVDPSVQVTARTAGPRRADAGPVADLTSCSVTGGASSYSATQLIVGALSDRVTTMESSAAGCQFAGVHARTGTSSYPPGSSPAAWG